MQDWLAHRVRTTPDREALVNASSGNAWTYATLDETVEEMAGRLAALGVAEGDHLGAVMESGVEEVCLIHAAMRLGAVLAPLPPEFTPPELAERFDRADVDAVVCDADTESQVRGAAERADPWLPVFTIDEADWSDATPLSNAEPTEFTPADWERPDTQLLLFTSGTTGNAKAVQLTMGNLLASAAASAFRLGVDPEDRWLVPLSLHHMGGIAPILRSTLYGTTVIVRGNFDPGGTVDDLREHNATCVSLVPTMLRRMLSARGTLPDSLRFALVGGAPCPAELVERCRDYSVPVCPTYGMTETASQMATARHTEAYDHPDAVGQPLLWTDVTVVDASGTPVEPGETGELVVRGPTVTPGYYDDPTATGEAIGAYGLHTGDVGYRDENGRLYVLNRLDDRILTGGENVDPGEVVDALRAHPTVEEAAVVGLDDEEWGERVAALLVPTDESEVDVAELESFLRERLAGYKLPRTIGTAEELPRTVSGTVEREAVRQRLSEGETERIEREQSSTRAADDSESGRTVAREESADEAAELLEISDEGESESGSTETESESGSTEAESDRPEPILDAGEDAESPLGREPAAAGEGDEQSDSARSLLDAGTNDESTEDSAGRTLDVDEPDELGPSEPIRDLDLDSPDADETEESPESDEVGAGDGEEPSRTDADTRRGRSALSSPREATSGLESDRLTGIGEGESPIDDEAEDDETVDDEQSARGDDVVAEMADELSETGERDQSADDA